MSWKTFELLPIFSFTEFEEIAQILIEKGANVNASNENGDSALNRAAITGRKSIFICICLFVDENY